MNWLVTRNNIPVKLSDIPELTITKLHEEILEFSDEKRLLLFYGAPQDKGILVYTVFADDDESNLYISSTRMEKGQHYPSLTPQVPVFHLFERELFEEFGIVPDGHPWLKPVRYSFNRHDLSKTMKNYPFFTMEGEEIHEVAVGPVHAGVIEPGHFRFMCHGETVHHLEIQLGYQHRGIEPLFTTRKGYQPHLAESIVGDSVIAHTTAYADSMESLGKTEISRSAMSIRAIALELERVAVHIGDLSALAGDIAYLPGNSVYGAIRTQVINTTLAICGNRFGRGLIRVGGVTFDLNESLRTTIHNNLSKISEEVELISNKFFKSPGVLSRLEKTGIVEPSTAKEIGMIGLAGRASGQFLDVRTDHPYGMYRYSPVHKFTLESGDVFARCYIRDIEIKQSIKFILEQLDNFPEDKILMKPVLNTTPNMMVLSMVEGWRGEIVHAALTDSSGNISRYKIKDPSFNNWMGLALALRGNGISDFPLCNKSFNLSYCGFDL